jgi:hypothetical protein
LQKYGLQKKHLGVWDLQSPWLAINYRFNEQMSLVSFSTYFFLFGWELDLPTSICREAMTILDLDDPNVQMHACNHKAKLFKKIMLMVFENIVIVKHQDTL